MYLVENGISMLQTTQFELIFIKNNTVLFNWFVLLLFFYVMIIVYSYRQDYPFVPLISNM